MNSAEQRFLFRLLWPRSPEAGVGRSFADKLHDLEVLREGILAEKDYARLRKETLGHISAKPRTLFLPWFSVGLFAVAFVVLVIYAVSSRRYELIWIATPAVFILILSWVRRIGELRARNDLSRTARLAILDELLGTNSISQDEASTLRAEIDRRI